jgi:hypothetical protein
VNSADTENHHLRATLVQMPAAEVTSLLENIGLLHSDLQRLAPLFAGKELFDAISVTLGLLGQLSDEISSLVTIQAPDDLQSAILRDYAPTLRVLNTMRGQKRGLVWTE